MRTRTILPHRSRLIGLAVTGAILAATVGGAEPASADDSTSRVVSEMSQVQGLIPSAPVGNHSGATSINSVDSDTPAPVAITLVGGSDGTTTRISPQVSVTPDALPGMDVAEVDAPGEASHVFVLRDSSAATDVSFTVGDDSQNLAVDPLGGVAVYNADGTVGSRISAPWAYDATGAALPTYFTVDGNTVTQHVDTTGAVFPVVADPQYTWGWVTGTVYFNKVETVKLSAGSAFAGAMLAFLPPPFNIAGAAVAGWTATVAAWAAADGKCVKIKYPTPAVQEYSGGYCR